MAGLFLIADCNSAKVFQFAEHAFDDMALFIHIPVIASLHFPVGLDKSGAMRAQRRWAVLEAVLVARYTH